MHMWTFWYVRTDGEKEMEKMGGQEGGGYIRNGNVSQIGNRFGLMIRAGFSLLPGGTDEMIYKGQCYVRRRNNSIPSIPFFEVGKKIQ